MNGYIEHANITLVNPKKTIEFLLAALPNWRLRGQGKMEEWFGKEVEWFHIGDDRSYIALQSGGDKQVEDWNTHWTGVKHIGIVVDDLNQTVERLKQAGYELDHWGGTHPHRRSVYYMDTHNMQFEFVEYFSEQNDERNDYSL
ncbi:VOC family protein [Vibrio mediterranei]|uniref:VOC family protein n=1 Tax=Vibrio mediterranei TaxID=689 RepID=UPI00148BC0F9|nr:VOC family protein [Vibrio mediterranei]NOI26221.1 VOC family protein [Vibrio mediterranei]